jgi:RHS repeat-associated protein
MARSRRAQSHNIIGAVATLSYPCSDVAGYPQGTQRVVNYGYTNGVLTSVGTWASSITYAPSGIIDTVLHGASGAAGSEVWTRDPSGMARPLSIAAKSPASVTHWTSGNYAYDGTGNIKAIGTMSYAYDPLHRLVRWTQNGANGASTWTGREYDRYGNPLYGTSGNCGTGGLGCTSTNGTPRAITGTTNRFTDTAYDAAGNVTADAGRSFTYDGLGMMTRAQIGTRHFRYLYSVDDERIAAIEKLTISGLVKFKTTYTIRGFENQLLGVWQTDPNTNAASWVEDEIHRGSSVLARERATGGTTHYFLDHLGSPRAITSATGTLLGTQQFDPWGFGGTTRGGALQFTSHERDAVLYGTGNTAFPDYMHARYYDVGGGRFLAVDPVLDAKRATRQPQAWNRYAYVTNNPLNRVDPTGRVELDVLYKLVQFVYDGKKVIGFKTLGVLTREQAVAARKAGKSVQVTAKSEKQAYRLAS